MKEITGIRPPTQQIVAFYMIPRNGGFQLRRVVIEEDIVLEDKNYDDPDAWDQVMSVLESEMSKKFK